MHITKQQQNTQEQKIGKCLFRHCTLSTYHIAFVFDSYQWFCHIDDDMYVNVLKFSQFLQQYDPHEPYYVGKWPITLLRHLNRLNEVPVSARFILCETMYLISYASQLWCNILKSKYVCTNTLNFQDYNTCYSSSNKMYLHMQSDPISYTPLVKIFLIPILCCSYI